MRLRKKFRSRGGAVVAMALQIICFNTILISLNYLFLSQEFSQILYLQHFKSYYRNCINSTKRNEVQKNQNRGVKLN